MSPPPVPISADRPVVAGPVLSAGRMVWVQRAGEGLEIRAQGPRGNVKRVAFLGRPPQIDPGRKVVQDVGAFAVRGRRVALSRSIRDDYVTQICSRQPCYAVPPVPIAVPFLDLLDRGTFGHVRTVAQESSQVDRCRVPVALSFGAAGLVEQRCVAGKEGAQRIVMGRRTLATGKVTLVGARGPWAAWNRAAKRYVVVRVRGRAQRYTTPASESTTATLDDGGRLLIGTSGFNPDPDPCRPGNARPDVAISVATPRRPAPRFLVRGAFNLASSGGAIALARPRPGCPPSYEIVLRGRDGEITPVSPALDDPPSGLAMDAEEIAVRQGDGLHRYTRPTS